jgi:hypothetical protein
VEYDEEEAAEAFHAAPARKIDWLIWAVSVARGTTEAVLDGILQAEVLLCGHANHQVDQAIFADEARRQIEQMTESEGE